MDGVAIVIHPADGTPLGGEFQAVIRLRAGQTGGALAALEQTVPPRRLIPPHIHRNDVWVYVLSGEIGILVGEEIGHTGAGGWALKPRNVMHAMWNRGDVGTRIIEVLTPGGTERWFEEIAVLAPDDAHGFADACQRHGIEFFRDSPWIPELRHRFGLR